MKPQTEDLLTTQLNWQKAERAPILLPVLMGLGLFIPLTMLFLFGWVIGYIGW